MSALWGKKYFILLVSLLSANPRAYADTLSFATGQTMQTQQINPQETVNNFQFGIVKVNYTTAPVTDIKLADREGRTFSPDSIFVTEAYATTTPIDQNVFTAAQRAHNALRSAVQFSDVKPHLSNEAYQTLLLQKRNSSAKELLLLQIIKTTIPETISIVQTQMKDDLAWAVARGEINGQGFWGILSLVKEDGQWKLAEETWYGNQHKTVVIKSMRNAEDFITTTDHSKSDAFIRWVDKAGQPKTSLPLEFGKIGAPKNSFCFFSFLDKEKTKKDEETKLGALRMTTPTPDMHIVWPSGVRYDPKVHERDNADGFDVSIAADKDGYYPNKVNLRLPRSKPREIYVGFLISF